MAVIGTAHIQIHAITAGLREEIERATKGIKPNINLGGGGGVSSLSRDINKASNSFNKLEKESESAKNKLNSLIKTGYAMGPAISTLVTGLSQAVSGLFALGSAIGAAAPALIVLPASMLAVGQAAITMKLAFGGVSKAISGMISQQNKGSAADGQSAASTRAVEDARKRLAQAYEQSAESLYSANKKVTDAQDNLTYAQQDTKKAQDALTQSYKAGLETLQQLGFDAESASLAEQQAAINLEKARETLQRVQDLPPDDRSRREAELAYKEADLAYRQAKDRVGDLAKEQEYAAKTGVNGTKEVIDAQNTLSSANKAEADARQAVSDAELDRQKQIKDNAQRITESQIAIQRALQDAANQAKSATSGATDYLKGLSTEAKDFVSFIVGKARPAFLTLREAAGKELFPKLIPAIQNIIDNLFPVLIPILTQMGGVVGDIALRLSKVFTQAENLEIFKRVFGGTNIQLVESFGTVLTNLAEAALNVLDAAQPLIVWFGKWLERVSRGIRLTTEVSNATGGMRDMFMKAGEIMSKIGGAAGKLFGNFKDLGGYAVDAGVKIIDAFSDSQDKFGAFIDETGKSGILSKIFDTSADSLIALGDLFTDFVKEFFLLGADKSVVTTITALKPLAPIFAKIVGQLTGAGPLVANFIVEVAKLLSLLTDAGGVEIFFKTLTAGVEIAVKIFSNEVVQKVFLFVAAVHGLTLALGLMGGALLFIGKAFLGKFLLPFQGASKIISLFGLDVNLAANRTVAAAERAAASAAAQSQIAAGAALESATLAMSSVEAELIAVSATAESAINASEIAATNAALAVGTVDEAVMADIAAASELVMLQTTAAATAAADELQASVIQTTALVAEATGGAAGAAQNAAVQTAAVAQTAAEEAAAASIAATTAAQEAAITAATLTGTAGAAAADELAVAAAAAATEATAAASAAMIAMSDANMTATALIIANAQALGLGEAEAVILAEEAISASTIGAVAEMAAAADVAAASAIADIEAVKATALASKKAGMFSRLGTSLSGSAAFGPLIAAAGGLGPLIGIIAAVVAAIAALAAIIYLMWQNSEKFRTAVMDLWESIKGGFVELWQTLSSSFSAVADGFGGMSKAGGGLSGIFEKLGDVIATYVIPILKIFIDVYLKYIGFILGLAIRYIGTVISTIVSIIRGFVDGITSAFGGVTGEGGVGGLVTAFQKAKDFISPVLDVILTVVSRFGQIVSQVFGMIAKLIGWLYGMYVKFVIGVYDKLLSLIGVTGGLGEAWNNVVGFIKNAINGIIDGINMLIEAYNSVNFGQDDIALIDRVKWGEDEKQIEDTAAALGKAADPAISYAKALEVVAYAQGVLKEEAHKVIDTLVEQANGLINLRDKTIANRDAFDELIKNINSGETSFRDLKTDLFKLGSGYLDTAQQAIDSGKSLDDVTGIVRNGRKAFLDGADAMGIQRDEARRLADKLGLVPKEVNTTFKQNGLKDLETLTTELDKLNHLTGADATAYRKDTEFRNYIKEQRNVLTAQINTALTVKFGRGEDSNNPLYVSNVGADGNPATPAAAGGTVMPRMGGTLLQVAEAGYPERVEPLDRMGLSRRDKALIKEMSGGGGGNTFNVYPATGMDERELAEAVSRKVAWQMRKGV